MGDMKQWVVEGILEGGLHISEKDSNLSNLKRCTVALTNYAIMEQNLQNYLTPRTQKLIYLGLEISIQTDNVCVAWQEMEVFVRALAIEKDVPIIVQIMRMTDKPEEWPKGIGFLRARNFPQCSRGWQPVDHHKDPKNRVRYNSFSLSATTRNLGLLLEERHKKFSDHNNYQSDLVKDYIAGLDVEPREPSLAMLYYYKILERIAKKEYGNPATRTITKKILCDIINDLNPKLTDQEKMKHANDINRWRHNKSEAHLITEGLPTVEELGLCKKLANLAILKKC